MKIELDIPEEVFKYSNFTEKDLRMFLGVVLFMNCVSRLGKSA